MATLTMKELNERMLALERLYPAMCKRHLLETWTSYSDSYFLEITAGVKTADADVDAFTVPTGKRAVLFVAAQQGDEILPVRPLFEATEALLAAAQIASVTPPPPAPPAPAPTVTLPGGQVFVPSDVTNILKTLDILIVPVANQRGYPTIRGEGRFGGVDVNRDYPVLWNGQRATQAAGGGAVTYKSYYAGNARPGGWNPPQPGLGSAPAKAQTTRNLVKLMRKRVQTLVNLASGYPPNVVYPWGFWENSVTAPLNTAMRYCNPAFGTGTPAVIPMATLPVTVPATAPYVEYMPATSLARLDAAATAAHDAAKAVGTEYWKGQNIWAGFPTLGFNGQPTGAFTKIADPAGGCCIDYFFSLDICNRIGLHFEVGAAQPGKDVTAIMFGLLKHLAALPATGDTTASTVTGVDPEDFMKEQAADLARTGTCP